jgi:IS30 family transposase
MWGMSEVFSQDKGPGATSATNCPILASTAVGHRHFWQVDPTEGSYTFIVVVVESLTKWIETNPLTNVSSASIKKFFWQSSICCYAIPRHITVDNTKYFNNAMFKDFCKQIGTKVTFVSVYHPQSNGAVENANSLIFEATKKILEGEKKGKCAEVMLTAIWSHNTIVCRATNFTPFRLMYGAKAVLPEEIKHQSL